MPHYLNSSPGKEIEKKKQTNRLTKSIFLLAKDMSPPNPSLLLLEMVEFGELLRESPSPSDSPGSLRLLGRKGRCAL